jgi:hypothetical protein
MSSINILETTNNVTATAFYPVKADDVTVNPFAANKLWTFYSGSDTNTHSALKAVYSKNIPPIGSTVPFNSDTNPDGSYQVSIYHSINHLFYDKKTQPYNTFGQNNITRTYKLLLDSASVFSIPQNKIGESIKHGSFTLQTNINDVIYNTSTPITKSINIHSDVYGNLFDSNYDTGSIVSGAMYYEGFNEYFNLSKLTWSNTGIEFIPGCPTTTGAQQPVGLAAKFSGAGYIETNLPGYYDRDNDYAVSFFVSASNTGPDSQLLITKANSAATVTYPFKLQLSSSNQIIASIQSSTSLQTIVTSSTAITDWTHVLCQKTGSMFELYIDGVLEASSSNNWLLPDVNTNYTSSGYIHNTDSLKIAGFSPNTSNLTGVLDEIRIFNRALTNSSISALNDRSESGMGFIQTNLVGNVFESQGLAVITSLDYAYNYLLNSPYTASYKSTVSLYELNMLVRVNKSVLNITTNPTALSDNLENIRPVIQEEEFQPYITTIGLYNSRNELLAIAKLAQPIQKRNDIDINFLVRIDLDKNLPPVP